MKKFFNTPKKAIISTLCITAVVLGAAVAVPAIILNTALIGKNDAEKAALNDAGLTASQVSGLRSELDYDDGSFRYEVDFYSNGTEYEYLILAKDGDIISRDTDGQPIANAAVKNEDSYKQTSDNNSKVKDTASEIQIREAVTEPTKAPVVEAVDIPAGKADEKTVNKPARKAVENTEISLDEAKAAALADAGLTENEVTFTEARSDRDDNRQIYDIEFYSADTAYDYEINAADGTVREHSVDVFRIQSDSTADVNSTEKYIGIDKAKEAALTHAGLTDSEVRFSKAKLENDDRNVEYEIEFYCGAEEYEYSIDANSGEVIEFSSERD